MPSIGDLANDLARTLYESRVAVAVLSIVLAVGVVLVARRLGWFAAARRHPWRAGTLVIAALVVALPAAWYLGSPIFLRSSLVEAAPFAVPSVAIPTASLAPTSSPAPSAVATTEPTAPPTATPMPTPTPFAPTTLAAGEFEGTDEFHFGRGTASLIEIEPGRYHLRLDDFSVRNGPDLFVYLSPDPEGYSADALELGRLKATDGSFGYDLPDGADPATFRSALIWCKQFSHLFAVATLEG